MMADITQDLERLFENLWNLRGAHNLSMPKEANIDWKAICHDFFLQGALATIRELKRGGAGT